MIYSNPSLWQKTPDLENRMGRVTRRYPMPSVIEIPETLEEEHVEQSHETLPPIPAPRRGFMTALLANVAPRHKQHSDRQGLRREEVEMPLDTLAREYPYLYIQAMAG